MAVKKQPCKVSSSTFVQYLFGICSVVVQLFTEQLLNKYGITFGQQSKKTPPEMLKKVFGALFLLLFRKMYVSLHFKNC